MNRVLNKNNYVKLIVFVVLFCTYIFPQALINDNYTLSKIIFITFIVFFFIVNIRKVDRKTFIFTFFLLLLILITRNYNYISFLSLPVLDIIITYEQDKNIKEYLKKSNILYFCFFFTLIYSILFFGFNGRYAYTAIKEVNQSGLAIFLLAVLMKNKNKNLSLIIFVLGFFTFSRSYLLAVLITLFFKFFKLKNDKVVRFLNYKNITILSSIIFILLGWFYIEQYKMGNINDGNIMNKFVNILDYSNYYRFIAILKVVIIFINYPFKILFGLSSLDYSILGGKVISDLGAIDADIVPHNLFFSHLKIYGIIAFIEIIYLSKILKKIVNKDNFSIYIAISLYSIILGAGLYSYWLYLTVFALIMDKENKTEKSIVSDDSIKVSICCTSYNQQDYIKQTLDSFIMQKTNFKFEVIIHDDASTDDTAKIIRDYEKKYSDIIKPIYQIENQYSKKVKILPNVFGKSNGKYIAICEGDDYWCDEYKLQKQYDFMEKNEDCSLITNGTKLYDDTNGVFSIKKQPYKGSRFYSLDEIIVNDGGLFSTNSMFFRKKFVEVMPEIYNVAPVGDFPLTIHLAMVGNVYYMDDIMSVYRVNAKGSWTTNLKKGNSIEKRKKVLDGLKTMFDVFNKETDYKYEKSVNYFLLKKELDELIYSGDLKKITKDERKKYKILYTTRDFKSRLKNYIKLNLTTIYEKIK